MAQTKVKIENMSNFLLIFLSNKFKMYLYYGMQNRFRNRYQKPFLWESQHGSFSVPKNDFLSGRKGKLWDFRADRGRKLNKKIFLNSVRNRNLRLKS